MLFSEMCLGNLLNLQKVEVDLEGFKYSRSSLLGISVESNVLNESFMMAKLSSMSPEINLSMFTLNSSMHLNQTS